MRGADGYGLKVWDKYTGKIYDVLAISCEAEDGLAVEVELLPEGVREWFPVNEHTILLGGRDEKLDIS